MLPFTLFSLGVGVTRLALDSQLVIAERLSRLSRGDPGAAVEAVRMVAEKTVALGEANARIVSAAATGRLDKVGPEIVALYGRKVRANRRRLARERAK
ncbi:hypothetical protein NVS89_00485 [Ancylobacter sp. MQZ15Z-1]|uniref:Antibiotic ABC transporter n=1 Tax=Ancylobacter mangrovi TaxID=2972472 RepID=A0A9X2T3H0_9HYPH|nr:hypothetical protein [Ancylobacter mangrovi]MCS0493554.1 hypothetical protein [Ancylobacter mangrovi]